MTTWLRLGNDVSSATSANELLEQAGLDWTVKLVPLFRELDNGDTVKVHARAVVREDLNHELGVVGERYEPYQNSSLAEIIEPLMSVGIVKPVRGGCFDNGQKIFVMSTTDTEDSVGTDQLRLFILFSAAHDGSGSVCLTMYPIDQTGRIMPAISRSKIRHSGQVTARVKAIADTIDLARGEFVVTMHRYRELQKIGMDSSGFRRYVKILFNVKDTDEDSSRLLAKVLDHGGQVSNAYEALKAVSDYFNSEKAGRDAEGSLESLWFGPNKEKAIKAMDKKLFDQALKADDSCVVDKLLAQVEDESDERQSA